MRDVPAPAAECQVSLHEGRLAVREGDLPEYRALGDRVAPGGISWSTRPFDVRDRCAICNAEPPIGIYRVRLLPPLGELHGAVAEVPICGFCRNRLELASEIDVPGSRDAALASTWRDAVEQRAEPET